MIKTFEELGDILAEFENRLSLIENSMPNVQTTTKDVQPEPVETVVRHINYSSDVSIKQWKRIDAISGQLNYLTKKHAELMTELDKLNKKPKNEPF